MRDNDATEDDLEARLTAGLQALVADAEPSPLLRHRLHRKLQNAQRPRRKRVRLVAAAAAAVAVALSVPLLRAAPSQQVAVGDGAAASTTTVRPGRAVAKPTTTTSVTSPASADDGAEPGASFGRSRTQSQDDDGHASPRRSATTSVPSEAPMPVPSIGATTPATASQVSPTTVPAPVLTMAVSFDEPVRRGDTVTWLLTVTNSGGPTTLVFPSAKSGEVFLTSESGRVVYDSNREMVWGAVYREEPLGAGASVTYTVTGLPLDVEPGRYRLTANLVSEPAPAAVSSTITVAP